MKGSELVPTPDAGVLAERVPLLVTVLGRPITQGSKTRTRWGMRDDNGDRLRPWREAVKQAALDAMGSVALADGTEGITPKGVHSVEPLSPGESIAPVQSGDVLDDLWWREGLRSPHPPGGGVPDAHPWERLEGPVSVSVVFTFDRPKSAPKSRRCWPITRSSGDLDKLVRAVFDALTDAGVWRDDSQVVRLSASKAHVGDPWSLHIPGACVTVRSVGP